MTVEDQRSENDVSLERFPVGMRVLAVDDDPTCLKILDSLLRKCQYQVTTTNQAIVALKMLRNNKTMFDLVISDVNMPDMDGFKLLEHVGLEMDLPVIMLSAHSDTKLVMKGITHGACDYLLKPVRIEELKNIWQHVVRRKKSSHSKSQTVSFGFEAREGENEAGQVDQNAKFNRKRKDQDEEEEEDSEDDGRENEDPTSQKKPRIVWTTELHKKFVDAVQQLGYDKAFPKKILDLMNHEGLTRENVASHLQKYRQFLKRLDTAERQKANAVPGVKDLSYLRMNPNEFPDLRALTQPVRLVNSALPPSVSQSGLFGRLNSPAGLGIRGMTSNGIAQPSNNSFGTLRKFHPSIPTSQTQSLFLGFPSPLELDKCQHIQQIKSSNPMGELSNTLSSGATLATGFTAFSSYQGNKTTFGVPDSSSTHNLMFGDGASVMTELNRCNEPWQSAVQSSNNLAIPSMSLQFGNSLMDFSSTGSLPGTLTNSGGDEGLIGNIVPSNNFAPMQTWEGGFDNNLNQNFSAFNNACDESNSTMLPAFPSSEIDKSAVDTNTVMPNALNISEQGKTQDGLIPNSYESLDEILNSLMKPDRNDPMSLMNGDFEFDNYPLSSCM